MEFLFQQNNRLLSSKELHQFLIKMELNLKGIVYSQIEPEEIIL